VNLQSLQFITARRRYA